ncbi:MAG: sulfatase-like hydrolase/transferase, partial [Gemmataceae bacterium]|nr:sulfatase-like hydrolase/transferase [Gemmataceae bacterium]
SVSRLDRGVGAVLEALRETGQLENTLILFLSDNGIPFPGAKTTLYEAGVHLPLIIAGPGLPSGRTNNALVSWVDIVPTILDWSKAKGPKYKLPGRSLVPIFDDDNPKGFDTVFGSHQFHEITMYYPMRSIIVARRGSDGSTKTFKLILNLASEREAPLPSDLWASPSWQSIRKRNDDSMGGKCVKVFLHRPKEELFDLSRDPDELTNIAQMPALADVLADLRRRLRAWQQETSDPWTILYREEDPKFNR